MAKPKKKEKEKNPKEEALQDNAKSSAAAQLEGAQNPQLDTRTLVGDVRDFVLDRLKHDKEGKPWAKMSEAEQSDAIESATTAAENLVRNTVDLVATQGFNNAKAEIDAWKVKGKQVVLTLKAFASEQNILALLNAGNIVTLTFANDEPFDQGRADCKPDPDQPGLGIEEARIDEEDDLDDEDGEDDDNE